MSKEATKLKAGDIEKKIVELAKKGETPEKIGLILRDEYAVPKTKEIIGKSVTQVLKENGFEEDFVKKNVEDKITNLKQHIESNIHDYKASRALTKKLWDKYHLEH